MNCLHSYSSRIRIKTMRIKWRGMGITIKICTADAIAVCVIELPHKYCLLRHPLSSNSFCRLFIDKIAIFSIYQIHYTSTQPNWLSNGNDFMNYGLQTDLDGIEIINLHLQSSRLFWKFEKKPHIFPIFFFLPRVLQNASRQEVEFVLIQ